MNISLFKSQKKGFTYLQVLTWRAGSADELTWSAGPLRGYDVALRQRGRAAGGPREAHVAHRARTRGRRPRLSMQTPVWGATWQGGRLMEGPRLSGPWLGDWGGNANALPRPIIYT